MSTPATIDQYAKLHHNLGKPNTCQLQDLIANSDLLVAMMNAGGLSRVDRSAFRAVLNPSIPWRPVGEYADKIAEWNRLRGWGGWGFTKAQITTLDSQLVDHLDPLHPTGISLWLGRDLSYNWEEAMACLKHEVEALGEKFTPQVESNCLSFFPGSEQSGERKLTVALLDLATYWDRIGGVVLNKARGSESRLPGLEVAWLLALNAPVYLAINFDTIPGLIAAGLVIDSGFVPGFEHDSDEDEAFVYARWAGGQMYDYTTVRFR